MLLNRVNYAVIVRNFYKFVMNKDWRFLCLRDMGALDDMPDKQYLERLYHATLKKTLDFNNPQTFNEKLQWLKLYDRNPLYSTMVDKIEAKKYVADIIGEEHIIPTLGIWDDPYDIDFSSLPDQFVLKCNHNSGLGMFICKDKRKINEAAVRDGLQKGLSQNYYFPCREWPYKNVRPRIFAEKYMMDESGVELKDYKIFNFNGRAKIIQVDYDRYVKHKRNLYTTNWEYIDAAIEFPNDATYIIKRPQNLDKMIELAERLSCGIPHVRTDFYSIDKKIYFGELTFYHGGGLERFTPEKLEEAMGEWLELPGEKKESGYDRQF